MSAQTIMITSGKGGTGKSTTGVLLGGALAELNKRVLLVELDTGLRSVDIMSGVYGKTVYDISDILSGDCSPNSAVVDSPIYSGLSIISAPYSGADIVVEKLKILLKKLNSHFDFILIDTAAGMGDAFKAALQCADMAIIVITADAVAVRDGRIVSDEIFNSGISNIRLLVNKVDVNRMGKNGIKNLDECIDTVCARLIGVVPESSAIMSNTATGKPLENNSTEKNIFINIAKRLCGEDTPLILK